MNFISISKNVKHFVLDIIVGAKAFSALLFDLHELLSIVHFVSTRSQGYRQIVVKRSNCYTKVL